MTRKAQKINRPSFLKFASEHVKVWKELWDSNQFRKSYRPTVVGDGHPVLIIPGFMGSDRSTEKLRKFLQRLGYKTFSWDLGRNYGDISQLNILLKRIEGLYLQFHTEVSLIGWSLGGVYARQLAKANPKYIRQIITLGSPFAGIDQPNNAKWLYQLINRNRKVAKRDEKWLENISAPAPLPTTAIYSKEDGIVPWEACLEVEDDIHQNIEVRGSHFGLAHNPSVWIIIENQLQYTREDWQKFELD